jgi:hypothetical protein
MRDGGGVEESERKSAGGSNGTEKKWRGGSGGVGEGLEGVGVCREGWRRVVGEPWSIVWDSAQDLPRRGPRCGSRRLCPWTEAISAHSGAG